MVPKGWEKNSLDSLFEFKNGLNTEKEQYGNGYKFVNVMDVFRNDILTESKIIGRVQVTDKQLEGYQLKYGDVLFNRTSETFDEIAIAAIYLDNAIATFGGFVIRARPKGNQIDPAYSVFLFQSKSYRSQVVKLGQGAIRANIGQKDLARVCILVPPLAEQKKIAQILSTWDKAISVTEKLLTNSQQQKKALMQQLLTGKKRLGLPAGSYEFKITRYGSIPKDWDYPAIKEICTQVSEKNSAAVDHPVLSCSKYDGFVDSLKYFNKKVYSDDLSGYRLIHRGCFGFPSNHIEEGSIGLQNLYDTGIVSPIYVVFRASPTKVDNSYLYAVLKTDHYKQIFGAATNASVDRRGSLRWKEFNQIHVPLPPLKEQQKISAVLSAADAEITTLEKKLACLKDEKKAMMQQLLTGKRRVKVDEAVAE